MKDQETISEEIFNKLRSRFSQLTLADSDAQVVDNVTSAVLFDFKYSDTESEFNNITISIVEPEVMRIYYSKSLTDDLHGRDRKQWFAFLDELRDFSHQRGMRFEIKDITKARLDKNDVRFLTKDTAEYSQKDLATESKMYGTKKSSYQEAPNNVRVIVRHTKPVNEEVRGARSRNIHSIFIENASGERFLVPRNHLPTARALARHISNEGNMHDSYATKIVEMHDEMSQLRGFVRRAHNTDYMAEGASSIVEAAKTYYAGVKKTLESIQKQSGYANWMAEQEEAGEALNEDDRTDEIREKLTKRTFNEEWEGVLPLLNKIVAAEARRSEEDKLGIDIEKDIYTDAEAEKYSGPEIGSKDRSQAVVKWLGTGEPLKLYDHPEDERHIASMRDKKQQYGNILQAISQHSGPFIPDEVAAFAGSVGDEMIRQGGAFGHTFGTPAERKAKAEEMAKNKKIAMELVKRYITDVIAMRQDAGKREELRPDSPAKMSYKKADERFENWADAIVEGAVTDELVSAVDELQAFAYELGNTHTDYEYVMDIAAALEAANYDDAYDIWSGGDTSPREAVHDKLEGVGPNTAEMADQWLEQYMEEPADVPEPAKEAVEETVDEEPAVEESIDDILKLSGMTGA